MAEDAVTVGVVAAALFDLVSCCAGQADESRARGCIISVRVPGAETAARRGGHPGRLRWKWGVGGKKWKRA